MRITKKKENGFYELNNGQEIYGEENGIRLVQIVGKYEDIEELCEKIVSQPVYVKIKNSKNKIFRTSHRERCAVYNFKEESIEIYSWEFEDTYYLKDYGKTWAFSKEELENDR